MLTAAGIHKVLILACSRFQDTESDFEHRGRMGRSQRLRGGVSDNTRKSRLRGITQYSLDNLKKSPSTMKRKNRVSQAIDKVYDKQYRKCVICFS